MYAQLMWWTSPLFHFAILVYADSLTHLQTFKNCPLSSSLLRTRIRHLALVRRHVTLLSTAESTAVPPDFCASFPRERPFQRAPGTVGGCPLAELVGSLLPKPGLQQQQPGWQEHIVPKCFCWVQAGRWGREKRARSGEHSRYWFYLLVSLTCSFPFLNAEGERVHRSMISCSPLRPDLIDHRVKVFANSTGSPQLKSCSLAVL